MTNLLLCILFFIPLVYSINFKITRFDTSETKVLYRGDAVASVGAVEFNGDAFKFRVGQVISAERLRLWYAKTKRLSDFNTRFSFIIDTRGSNNYGAGLAFFLAPVGFQIPPNSGGGFLGLFNTSTMASPSNQIVAVEFDSFSNQQWDPPGEHVGINNNSIASAIYTPWNASFHSGDTADAVINYNATTKNLSVSWAYHNTYNPKENTSLSYNINLMEILPEWVIIGFSASTNIYTERNILKSWEFSSSLDVKETADNKTTKKLKLVLGIIVSGVTLLTIGIIITFVMLRKRKQNRKETAAETANLASTNDDLERGAGPRKFSFQELAAATNNFSKERKLGEGGFGAVYKGYLNSLDMHVAVKKISRGSKQGRKEYVTEVKIISSLRHRNLVQLIGWCHDKSDFLLVYDYMPNGSLDFHLFGNERSLTWVLRYKISLGLASALLYLHEEWEQCVVHRDIKSSNVLLDSSFNVKLGDFGLARLMDHELGPQTTRLAGTLGYLAPEYVSTGRASKESDVYSFGVVALEIATGKKSTEVMVEGCEMGLVEWVWSLYGKGKLSSAVDERIGMNFDEKEIDCLMIVGLWCAHPDRSLRPAIRQVTHVLNFLNFEAVLPSLPTKMPVPMYHMPTQPATSSKPSITTSLEVGR